MKGISMVLLFGFLCMCALFQGYFLYFRLKTIVFGSQYIQPENIYASGGCRNCCFLLLSLG